MVRKNPYNVYYQSFPFAMLTSVEQALLHMFLLTLVSLVAYGIYSIPSSVPAALSRVSYYLTGRNDVQKIL